MFFSYGLAVRSQYAVMSDDFGVVIGGTVHCYARPESEDGADDADAKEPVVIPPGTTDAADVAAIAGRRFGKLRIGA